MFVCLMGGMVVATLIAVVEFIFHLRDQASDDNVSLPSPEHPTSEEQRVA